MADDLQECETTTCEHDHDSIRQVLIKATIEIGAAVVVPVVTVLSMGAGVKAYEAISNKVKKSRARHRKSKLEVVPETPTE